MVLTSALDLDKRFLLEDFLLEDFIAEIEKDSTAIPPGLIVFDWMNDLRVRGAEKGLVSDDAFKVFKRIIEEDKDQLYMKELIQGGTLLSEDVSLPCMNLHFLGTYGCFAFATNPGFREEAELHMSMSSKAVGYVPNLSDLEFYSLREAVFKGIYIRINHGSR